MTHTTIIAADKLELVLKELFPYAWAILIAFSPVRMPAQRAWQPAGTPNQT